MATTAAVTGASGGIGAAVARAFAEDGAMVVLGGRDRDAIEALADELGGESLRTDVRDEFELERLMERASKAGDASGIDVVVPCAAVCHDDAGEAPLPAESYSAFDDTMRTNARGVFAAIREALPHMAEDGRVVVPTDAVARDSSAGAGAYAVSKAAVEGIARQFAADCEQAVGCVDPGRVETSLRTDAGAVTGDGERDPEDVSGMFTWAAANPGALDGSVLCLDDWETATA